MLPTGDVHDALSAARHPVGRAVGVQEHLRVDLLVPGVPGLIEPEEDPQVEVAADLDPKIVDGHPATQALAA